MISMREARRRNRGMPLSLRAWVRRAFKHEPRAALSPKLARLVHGAEVSP